MLTRRPLTFCRLTSGAGRELEALRRRHRERGARALGLVARIGLVECGERSAGATGDGVHECEVGEAIAAVGEKVRRRCAAHGILDERERLGVVTFCGGDHATHGDQQSAHVVLRDQGADEDPLAAEQTDAEGDAELSSEEENQD